MSASVKITRVWLFVLLAVAGFGGAGIDRMVVSSHAETACPVPPAPAVPPHEKPLPRQPFLPVPSGRSW